MPLNIHVRRLLRVAPLVLLARGATGQTPRCGTASGQASAAGWHAYRAGSLGAADARFSEALRLCPGNVDAIAGLGYLALRRNELSLADSLFRGVIARDSADSDGWDGLARVAARLGDSEGADLASRHVLTPTGAAITEPASAIRRSGPVSLPARVRGERFEIPSHGRWIPFYIKGVNFGVALPGKFPSEFPADSTTYAGWLSTIASLHANTVRVYTILPPAFYRALRAWNDSHPAAILWLLHGVWAELPADNDFDNAAWRADFEAEMRRVVDIVHGASIVPPRPGHAAGRFDADVSRWTLGFILGREWEPYAVAQYDSTHARAASPQGKYLELTGGTPMDAWLTTECDRLLSYEASRYSTLHPIAYTNWPTLDPLHHPTEASAAEERAWRRRMGRPEPARHEYENDVVSLDAALVRPTAANPAGWFASYHAYPYYPDFMIQDPEYNRARSSEGRSNYFGYLSSLIAHHRGMPVVIAEYGVPSSRGDAHLQPQGWDHGGHDEMAMARIDARLTREIHEAGAAGGILFSWLDEWFKHNWLVMDFEIPAERARLWHSTMDAEQNYGLMGEYAGDGRGPRLGAESDGWRRLETIAPGIRAGSDASFVYLALELGRLDWRRDGVEIGIDTYRQQTGQHRLPASGVTSPTGFEFLVSLSAPDSGAILALPEYNRYAAPLGGSGDDATGFFHRPVATRNRNDGRFDRMLVVTNRSRFGRDGTFFPAQVADRGLLRFGTEAASTLSDWYYDSTAGMLELRLPWDLLNVTDPSSRSLLDDQTGSGDFSTVTADAFHFLVVRYEKGSGRVTQQSGPAAWSWKGWNEPVSHAHLKPAADSMQNVWERLP